MDNGSTYAPLLEYYETTPHTVVRLGENVGHLAPWTHAVIERYASGPYVVTDPDVVPIEQCPKDAVAYLLYLLERHPSYTKAGLGLMIDDIPLHYALATYVRSWEAQHWDHEIAPGVFDAPVDTTFAVYRPGHPFTKSPALRTATPYLVRHLPWYVDSSNISDEERYYRTHALKNTTNWNRDGRSPPPRIDAFFHRSLLARLRRRIRSLLSH